MSPTDISRSATSRHRISSRFSLASSFSSRAASAALLLQLRDAGIGLPRQCLHGLAP